MTFLLTVETRVLLVILALRAFAVSLDVTFAAVLALAVSLATFAAFSCLCSRGRPRPWLDVQRST